MAPKYVPPVYEQPSFSCPHCGVLAPQKWYSIDVDQLGDASMSYKNLKSLRTMLSKSLYALSPEVEEQRKVYGTNVSICQADFCWKIAFWINGKLEYPIHEYEIMDPSDDMPESVREIYDEARAVYKNSPRAAAALLRLALETLLSGILGHKKNLHSMIGEIVEKFNVHEKVQKSLDSIRHFGNEGAHSGEIDLNEQPETVHFLFQLLCVLTDELINRQNRIDDLYMQLPESVRDGINKRDKRA